VARRRLPGLDVTVGVVAGAHGLLVIDTGATIEEGGEVLASVRELTGRRPTHVVITHGHFDHCFGTAAFGTAEVYGHRGLGPYLERERAALRADAVRYGVDPASAQRAAGALVRPDHAVDAERALDLGGRTALLVHPGPGHTDHDLAVVVRGAPTVVFCGDLVEESGEPQAGPDARPERWPAALDRLLAVGGADALFVPGHGSVVDARFVRVQRSALAAGFGVS
jgi:glyoxylase-like metal-dependent hydrolase (beta-lactamase superfamily II)